MCQVRTVRGLDACEVAVTDTVGGVGLLKLCALGSMDMDREIEGTSSSALAMLKWLVDGAADKLLAAANAQIEAALYTTGC